MRASAPTGAQQKRQRSPLTVWPMASHLLQGDVPTLTLPGFAPRGDTSNKGARRPFILALLLCATAQRLTGARRSPAKRIRWEEAGQRNE